MNDVKLCELVRQQENADRMFCLYPQPDGQGFFKAKTIACYRSLTLRMDFFDTFDVSIWVKGADLIQFRCGRKVGETGCFLIREFISFLFSNNRMLAGVVIYSLFGRLLTSMRGAAAYAAYAAACAAAEAAYAAAAEDAAAAYDAACAAEEAAYDAAEAAYDAAEDAAAAKNAYYAAKKAFRKIIKWRKLFYK